jgi:hypothetical protein
MYGRVDGTLADEPDYNQLSDAEFGVFMRGVLYITRQLSDGLIPKHCLNRVSTSPKARRYSAQLVTSGVWTDEGDSWRVRDWRRFVDSADEVQQRRERTAKKVADWRARKAGVTELQTSNLPVSNRVCNPAISVSLTETVSGSVNNTANPVTRLPLQPAIPAEIAALEARYDTRLVSEAREACSLTRRNGKMQDTVWLRVLKTMEVYRVESCETAMRLFVEQYANGNFDERYMLGIAKKEDKRRVNGNGALWRSMAPPSPASDFPRLTTEQVRNRVLGIEDA